MLRRLFLALSAPLALLTFSSADAFAARVQDSGAAFATRVLDSFDYFCPVTFQLVLRHEQPATSTPKGAANTVSVVRYGNRELLAPIATEHGGELSDWSLVAYASSLNFESFDGLAIVARRKDGAMYPVTALNLADLAYSAASSSAYSITTDSNDDLFSASFDQKSLATYQKNLFGGTLVASGKVTSTLSFGPLTFSGQTQRAFKPGTAKLVLVGVHTADGNAETSVAELTVTVGKPKLVPQVHNFTGGEAIIVIDGTQVSPN